VGKLAVVATTIGVAFGPAVLVNLFCTPEHRAIYLNQDWLVPCSVIWVILSLVPTFILAAAVSKIGWSGVYAAWLAWPRRPRGAGAPLTLIASIALFVVGYAFVYAAFNSVGFVIKVMAVPAARGLIGIPVGLLACATELAHLVRPPVPGVTPAAAPHRAILRSSS
jgi:hypothetical protein